MLYRDSYTIELLFGDEEFTDNPNDLSFSVSDSLHSLLPTAVIQLKDGTGLYREYQLMIEGRSVNITYGLQDDARSCPFVVLSNETPETLSAGFINGVIKANLSHAWADQQAVRSFAYKGPIDKIVKEVASKGGFKRVEVDATQNNDVWYQPLLTDAQFIQNQLLPNAFSEAAEGTPYFAFTTTDNIFNFKTFASLVKKSPVAELENVPPGQSTMGINTIMDIKVYVDGATVTRDLRHRNIYQISPEDGSLSTEEETLADYPSSRGEFPLIGDGSTITGSYFDGFSPTEEFEVQNFKGRLANSRRRGLLLDKLIVTVPLNRKLKSGEVVEIVSTLSSDEQGGTNSLYYSGRYLIENSRHVWSGENANGFTQIVVGRKYASMPQPFKTKKDLFQP